ncbi:MAG: hypothetical protein KJ749_02835, partial [Planctomycetes bacterium]|nr:hypothetical protein [Planctomycetota bacterium]
FWNGLRKAVHEGPVRVSAAVVLVGVVWIGLYFLFHEVFQQLERTPLEATVAIPLVLNFFFAVMLILLTFSNAIIAYSTLFERDESAYLLSSPVQPLDVVTLKYLESLVLSSWALVVLGLPLMLAMAELAEQMVFYVLFLSFFLAFIPIPGALGLMLAWMAARFFPRQATRLAGLVAGMAAGLFAIWGLRSLQLGDSATEVWLRSFYARMSFVESAFLPNNWIAVGIDHAIHGHLDQSLLYLGVTVANALFLSWAAVMIVSRYFSGAFDHASTGRDGELRVAATASGGFAGYVFFYLPLPLRLIAAKDLRTFFRDPMQWSQLVILFGLLALYLTNMPTLQLRFGSWYGWSLVIPFLNLCAISLILATFTCRFVFPLASLEGHKLWVIGMLPMPRSRILLAKFAFAMTITLIGALGAMVLAAITLKLHIVWALAHVGVIIAVSVGLCGLAVGIGARFPMFKERKIARIANGLGGTINLLISIALVAVVLILIGVATWRSRLADGEGPPGIWTLATCLVAAAIAVIAGRLAMIIGAQHFDRVEV